MKGTEGKERVTIQAYAAYVQTMEGRAEYYDGVIYDMAGGTDNHSKIGLNVGVALHNALTNKQELLGFWGRFQS